MAKPGAFCTSRMHAPEDACGTSFASLARGPLRGKRLLIHGESVMMQACYLSTNLVPRLPPAQTAATGHLRCHLHHHHQQYWPSPMPSATAVRAQLVQHGVVYRAVPRALRQPNGVAARVAHLECAHAHRGRVPHDQRRVAQEGRRLQTRMGAV